jgi:hypothetical protein
MKRMEIAEHFRLVRLTTGQIGWVCIVCADVVTDLPEHRCPA